MLNPTVAQLQTYPAERKTHLFSGLSRPVMADLTIGEPQHQPDPRVVEILHEYAASSVGKYPRTRQESFLTEAIIESNKRSKQLKGEISPAQVLAGCGSGELLYSFATASVDPSKPYVLIPNPSYQVYRVAAQCAGGTPYFFDLDAANNFQPDFEKIPAQILERTSICYINSPNNPCAVCYSEETLRSLVELARRFGFAIASDECYLEIYFGDRPLSILEVCAKIDGDNTFSHVVAFDSLSKRSSLPGLRSGTMVGDAKLISNYLKLRMSERKVMPLNVQHASAFAWSNDADVEHNRTLYADKVGILQSTFEAIGRPVTLPQGTFFCWLDISDLNADDQSFALELAHKTGVLTFPGSFFSVTSDGGNPGAGFLRIALIDSIEATQQALSAIAECIKSYRS
jgi:N-succinyldiaminopimelate aminotransferase